MAGDHDKWREHTHAIGAALVDAAPSGWRRIDLLCRATVDVQDHALTVVMADRSQVVVPLPEQVPRAVLAIRSAFYGPGEGTWFSFRFMIDPPGHLQSVYEMDWDPRLGDDPAMWVREQAAFPRSPSHMPPWLRAKLVAAGQVVAEVEPAPTPDSLWQLLRMRIAFAVPADWAGVTLSWFAGARVGPKVLVRRVCDDSVYEWEPPPEVAELLTALRAMTRRPDGRAWRQVTATINHNASADYSYTWDPDPMPHLEMIDPTDPMGSASRAAADLEVPADRYRVLDVADGAWCLTRDGDRWAVFRSAGSTRRHELTFGTAVEAAQDFVKRLYRDHAVFWTAVPAGAKRMTDEWPIQPVGGDVGLQMYGGKRLEILPPHTTMDRYGDPAGNTLYAAGTEFPQRSEPDVVLDMDFHAYRLRKPVRAITGTVIAWYDQPGGGTAHVLEHPVAHYLETGAIEEITGQ